MSRPRAHVIDEVAQRIFLNLLPPEWQQQPLRPDYRIDYLVEVFQVEKPAGLTFGVQLKGTRRLERIGSELRFSMETEHLAFYLDKARFPVFLIVIEVSTRQGYWLFLQEYLLSNQMPPGWRQQRSVTLSIPVSNDLRTSDRLLSKVREAHGLLAELHPASICGAIAADKKRHDTLDHRFETKVSVSTDGDVHYEYSPKVDVSGKIEIKATLAGKFREMVANGTDIEFGPGEIRFVGLPLMEDFSRVGGTLAYKWQRPASVRISDRANPVHAIEFAGVLEGGLDTCRYSGQYAGGILRLQFALSRKTVPMQCPVTMVFSPEPWLGTKLSLLPSLDALDCGCLALLGEAPILELFPERGRRAVATLRGFNVQYIRSMKSAISALRNARRVCSRLGMDPTIPNPFGADEIDEVGHLCELLRTGVFRVPGGSTKMNLAIGRAGAISALEGDFGREAVRDLRVSGTGFTLWGQPIELGNIEVTLTNAELARGKAELLRTAKALPQSGVLDVPLRGCPESEFVLEADRCPYPRVLVPMT